jgi:hypothetical protein
MQPGQEVFPEGQSRGRITIYCIAETLNRDLLSKKLRDRGPNFQLQVMCCMSQKATCPKKQKTSRVAAGVPRWSIHLSMLPDACT